MKTGTLNSGDEEKNSSSVRTESPRPAQAEGLGLDQKVAVLLMEWREYNWPPSWTDGWIFAKACGHLNSKTCWLSPPDLFRPMLVSRTHCAECFVAGRLLMLPNFSTRIEDAMSVVEQLERQGFSYQGGLRKGVANAEFINSDKDVWAHFTARVSLPEAICRAALATLNEQARDAETTTLA